MLDEHDQFLIPLHLSPDGDVQACALAMREVLISLGKTVQIISEDEPAFIGNYSHIYSAAEIQSYIRVEPLSVPIPNTVILLLDGDEWYRYSKELSQNDFHEHTIVNIDHHSGNTKNMSQLTLVDSTAAACSQILLDLFNQWQIPLSKKVAQLLMSGIYTDTNGLENENVDARVFNDLKQLTDAGADWHEFVWRFAWSVDPLTIDYLREYLQYLKTDLELGFAWVALPLQLSQKYDETPTDTEYAKKRILQVLTGIDFVCELTEKDDGGVNFSFRRRTDKINVAELAKKLSHQAGGHPAAAGARLENVSLAEAETKLLNLVHSYSKS